MGWCSLRARKECYPKNRTGEWEEYTKITQPSLFEHYASAGLRQLTCHIWISVFCAFILMLAEGHIWLVCDRSDVTVLEQHRTASDITAYTFSLNFNTGWKANNMFFFHLYCRFLSFKRWIWSQFSLTLHFITILRTGEEWAIWYLKQWPAHLLLQNFLDFPLMKTISLSVPPTLSILELSESKITV